MSAGNHQVLSLAAGAALCLSASAFGAFQDFTSDPGWAASRSGLTFGWSPSTNNAGGATGEIGGAMPSRTNAIDWYADTDLGGSLTQLQPFSASGRFTISPRTDFDGGFALGFFDRNGTLNAGDDGHFVEGAYFRIIDGNEYRVSVSMAGERGPVTDPQVIQITGGPQDYLFTLTYNPTGGGPTTGRLSAEVRRASDNGLVGTVSVDADNALGQSYNTFGLITGDYDRVGASSDAFFDDLTYTEVPEPAIGTAFGLAGLAMLGRRRGR